MKAEINQSGAGPGEIGLCGLWCVLKVQVGRESWGATRTSDNGYINTDCQLTFPFLSDFFLPPALLLSSLVTLVVCRIMGSNFSVVFPFNEKTIFSLGVLISLFR